MSREIKLGYRLARPQPLSPQKLGPGDKVWAVHLDVNGKIQKEAGMIADFHLGTTDWIVEFADNKNSYYAHFALVPRSRVIRRTTL